ncbi:mitogen-activated protein kinase, putative [Leishmania tarentolae]|uniref:cyclin-dependent kinase n=1 Tax=Leishmania tarentolae TaxID=5689 RepID=A0A640KLR8_LEITA|nr:mitogen-activated protein kinase, putative [Leishmania tarentolae]
MENYDVHEVIGEGTYGIVFKCRDKRTNQIVAVKQFKNFQMNAYVRVAMLRELRVEQLLKGEPNVTQLLEAFKQKNRLYLVMEYIPRSLLDVLEEVQHGLSEDSLVVLLFTILLGIRSCHRNGIIHRDVKPENILVRDDGAASLCDFGFCRPLPCQLHPRTPPSSHQLSTAAKNIGSSGSPIDESGNFPLEPLPSPNGTPEMFGGTSVSSANSAMLSELVLADHQAIMTNYVATRWYRSPEMLLGMPSYTYAVDMWAVGAIMAEAIDGEPLLPGKTELEQLSLIQTRIGNFPKAYEAAVRKRNGGMLHLRSLNPLQAPPQQLRTKPTQQKSRRASDTTCAAQKCTESNQGTSSYLTERYGGRIAKDGMDLLHRLLRVDAAERITVEEALEHPYFDNLRGRFHVTVDKAHRDLNSNGGCDEAVMKQVMIEKTTESTPMPPTTTTLCQESLHPLTATGAVDSTSTFSAAPLITRGGGSPCLVAATPQPVEIPCSLVNEMGAGVGNDGGNSLHIPCGAERSPHVTTVACEGSLSSPGLLAPCAVAGSNDSTTSSSSLSLWTASNASAEAVPPTHAMEEKDYNSLPQLPSVLTPLLKLPKLSEAGAGHTTAPARSEAAKSSNSPPATQLTQQEDNNGDKSVLRLQKASEGVNARHVQRDASVPNDDCSPTSLHQSWQSDHNPRDVRGLLPCTYSLESGMSLTKLRGTSASSNRAAQEPSGADGAASAATVSNMDVSAPLSPLQSGQTTQKRRDDVVISRLRSRKLSATNTFQKKSPFSLLENLYTSKSIPMRRSKGLVANVGKSTSQHDLMHSEREENTEVQPLSGPMSAPRSQGSRGGVEHRAAASSKSAQKFRSGSVLSNARRSARGDTGRTGGLSSATKERRFSLGTGLDVNEGHTVSAAPAYVHETTLSSSCRATEQEPEEMSMQKRRSTAKSRPPPSRGWCTSTPTAPTGIKKGKFHNRALPKPPFHRISSETSGLLSANHTRAGGVKKRALSRFASPHLPREVRPLPAPERLTLLQEIQSLDFLVGSPSAVEVLGPAVAAPVSYNPENAESVTDDRGGAQGRNQGGASNPAIAVAGQMAPASQQPEMLDTDVLLDRDCDRDNSSLSLKLSETRKKSSVTASQRTSPTKRDTVASGTTLNLGEDTGDGELEEDVWQQSFQRPPHHCGTTSGRPLRMDSKSLSGTTRTHSANATTVGSSQATPCLVFRSSRTVSSPLKLGTVNPFSLSIPGEGDLRELPTNGCHASPSSTTGMPFTTPNAAASLPVRRLAPALLRHSHITINASACSAKGSNSLGPDPVFGSSLSFSNSLPVATHSASSPILSPKWKRRGEADARRASTESSVVSLSGARPQRRLSDIPAEVSLNEGLNTDVFAHSTRVGGRRHENATPLSTIPHISITSDLDTVMLTGTPPENRCTDKRCQDEVPCTATWSPAHSGTMTMMSTSMPGICTPYRGLDGDNSESPDPFEGRGPGLKTDVVGLTSMSRRYSVTPALFPAAPKCVTVAEEDDVMNVSDTPLLPMRGSLETCVTGNGMPTSSRKVLGPSLAPPQPLLGGANALSAQQLHAGGGRRKSRLVL